MLRLVGREVAVEHDQKDLHVEALMTGFARDLVDALVAVPARRHHRLFVHPVHFVGGLVVAVAVPWAVIDRGRKRVGLRGVQEVDAW